MTVLDYQVMMRLAREILDDLGPQQYSTMVDLVAERCNLSDEDRALTTDSCQSVVANRVGRAVMYVIQAGQFGAPAWAVFGATDRGRELPHSVDRLICTEHLTEFNAFQRRTSSTTGLLRLEPITGMCLEDTVELDPSSARRQHSLPASRSTWRARGALPGVTGASSPHCRATYWTGAWTARHEPMISIRRHHHHHHHHHRQDRLGRSSPSCSRPSCQHRPPRTRGPGRLLVPGSRHRRHRARVAPPVTLRSDASMKSDICCPRTRRRLGSVWPHIACGVQTAAISRFVPMPEQQAKQSMQPPFPIETVRLEDLDLDLRNSRFPRDAQSQDDALHLMLATAGEDCLQLLRDVTRSGQLNSADLPIVVRKGGRFVVMEGNRRLSCLRTWHDSTILSADEEIERAYLTRAERLIADSAYAAPAELRVAIAPSEEAADPWIERKHAKGAGGAGTVEWGAAMKDRRKARSNPAAASRAMAFIELVATELEDEDDIQADLETVRTMRYTMIQRFVDRGIVRERLGLDFDAGRMTFSHGAEATTAILRAVLHDFAQPKADSGKTWARELDTVADFTDYLDGFAGLLPGRPDGGERGSAISSGTDTDRSSDTGGGSGAGTAGRGGDPAGSPDSDFRPPRPTSPPAHIFRGLVLAEFTNRIQEIVRQSSLLNVQRQTEVVSVLLRVILDLATYQFLKSHGMTHERHLDRNLRSAIKKIDPRASDALGQAESTSQLQKAFHETTADTIRLVQYAVHDVHSARTPNEVLILAARYQPVLVAMNQHMGNNPIV